MTAQRDAMTLNESSVPALGVEDRSDEAPRAGRARPTPDPDVVDKPKRRQFTARYRLRILEDAERCTHPGEVGWLLRREGLYSSHLTAWRKAWRKGSLRELAPKKRGANLMQVMMERDREHPLSGSIELDDAYLGGERSGGTFSKKVRRMADNGSIPRDLHADMYTI